MDTSPDVTVWFKGADGERQAIRVDSRDTHGTYAVIESVATPGCAAPTHSWRNIAAEESRLLTILTPGGFEQIVYSVKDTPPEKIRDLAARFGCDIIGPPVAE